MNGVTRAIRIGLGASNDDVTLDLAGQTINIRSALSEIVGLMKQPLAVFGPIRLKSSKQTFFGTRFVSQKTGVTRGRNLACLKPTRVRRLVDSIRLDE